MKSLKNIFNVSRDRAEKCADIMGELMSKQGKYGVQVHEFFLHEAQQRVSVCASHKRLRAVKGVDAVRGGGQW